MSEPGQDATHEFVERVALLYEQSGLPRIAGRILGWLLICDPPLQSATELAAAVGASKGSVSTMTRMLLNMGLISAASKRGDRRDYFHIPPQQWVDMMRREFAGMTVFRELAESGLAALGDAPPAIRARLETMRAMYEFFERELPALLQRWQQEHQEGAQ
jgi:DNA-binding transcriptional regulator GbsR (MarR family)